MSSRFYPIALAAAVLALCAGAILFPWASTAMSASGSALVSILGEASGQQAIINSVLVGLASVAGAGLLGTGLALALRYVRVPFPRVACVIASLPLALPPLVGAASFYFLLSEGGVLPRTMQLLTGIDAHAVRIEGFWAVAAIHIHAFYVYFYFFVDDGLDSIDRSEVEAAQQLGASGAAIAARIVFPHLKPALVRAFLLVFIASLASFSAPLLFGGGMRFLTTEIYNAKLNGSSSDAATYAMLLSAASVVFLFVARARKAASKGTGRPLVRRPGRFDPALGALTWLVLFAVALPPLMLVLLAFAQEGSWTTQILPASYSMEHVTRLFTDGSALRPLLTSMMLGGMTVVLTTLIASASAYTIARPAVPWALRRAVELVGTLPSAIPGTVIGVNLLLAFSVPHFFTADTVLTGTMAIMLIAYVTRTLPFAVQGLSAGYSAIPVSLEEAAASLGAGPLRTARRVIAPLLAPALLSSAVFTFVTAFGEFPASTLLFTPRARPASMEILQHLRLFDLGAAAALGVAMILISATAIAVGRNRRNALPAA